MLCWLGWLLFIGRDILVPVVFSVLVLYVILGLARLLARLPVVGAQVPSKTHYALSILTILVILLLGAWLIITQLGNVAARAPDYQSSLLSMVQRVGGADIGFRRAIPVADAAAGRQMRNQAPQRGGRIRLSGERDLAQRFHRRRRQQRALFQHG